MRAPILLADLDGEPSPEGTLLGLTFRPRLVREEGEEK